MNDFALDADKTAPSTTYANSLTTATNEDFHLNAAKPVFASAGNVT